MTGSLSMFFDVASQSFLPVIVPRDGLPGANAAMQVSGQTAQVGGPGLAGLLVSVFGAPYAVAADCASYLASAALLSRVKKEETTAPKESRRALRSEIREGLSYVLRHPILRPNLMFTSTANVFNSILFAVLLLFAVRRLHLSARQVGLVLMLANVGSLAGAVATTRLQRRFGFGRVMLVTAFSGWALLLIPFASGAGRIPLLAAGLLLWDGRGRLQRNKCCNRPGHHSARTDVPHGRFRRLIAWGAMPAGTLIGGLLGTYLGLRTAVFIGAGRACPCRADHPRLAGPLDPHPRRSRRPRRRRAAGRLARLVGEAQPRTRRAPPRASRTRAAAPGTRRCGRPRHTGASASVITSPRSA